MMQRLAKKLNPDALLGAANKLSHLIKTAINESCFIIKSSAIDLFGFPAGIASNYFFQSLAVSGFLGRGAQWRL